MLLTGLLQSKTFITILGLVAGTCTSAAMLPQLIKAIKTKKVEDVSPLMIVVLITGVSIWIFYGFIKKDIPIISTNLFSLALNITMLFFRIKYSKNK